MAAESGCAAGQTSAAGPSVVPRPSCGAEIRFDSLKRAENFRFQHVLFYYAMPPLKAGKPPWPWK